MRFQLAGMALAQKEGPRYALSLAITLCVMALLFGLAIPAGLAPPPSRTRPNPTSPDRPLGVSLVYERSPTTTPSADPPPLVAQTADSIRSSGAPTAELPAPRQNNTTLPVTAASTAAPVSLPEELAMSRKILATGAEIVHGQEAIRMRERAARSAARESLRASLQTALQEKLVYPAAARRAGTEGRVRLRLRITRSGQLEYVEILEKSGSGVLDAAALRLARRIFPIAGSWPSGLETDVSIEYRLK